MRKILIPTDFSENALNAIIYATRLFKYDTCEFIILHAFAEDVYENTLEMPSHFLEQYKEKVKESSDRSLQEVVVEILENAHNPKHDFEYVSIFDDVVDACNQLVDKHNIDLIIMGTKGEANHENLTFGSKTLQVVKYVACPVLMVPQQFHKNQPENILFATDYMIPYKRRELKLVSTIAKNFGAMINFLHITKIENSSHRQLDNKSFLEACTKHNQTTFFNMQGESVPKVIHEFIAANGVNLLVMVNSHHSYMESLLETSKIDQLGLKIEIPFLVLQNLPR